MWVTDDVISLHIIAQELKKPEVGMHNDNNCIRLLKTDVTRRTGDSESQVRRPNHSTTEPPDTDNDRGFAS